MSEPLIRYAWVNAIQTTELLHYEEPWSDVVAQLGSFEQTTEEGRRSLPLFIGWEFVQENPELSRGTGFYSRCHNNCLNATMLTLDVDNFDEKHPRPIYTFEQALHDFDGLECLIYTSFNHLNTAKHGGIDKFRIVLPLARPVPFGSWQARLTLMQQLFPFSARESFTPSQPFWPALETPARSHLSRSVHLRGEWLDLISQPPLTPPRAQAPPPPPSKVAPSSTTFPKVATTYIKSVHHGEDTVENWYLRTAHGYEHRVPCFSCTRVERNATAFFFVDGDYLIHKDMGGDKKYTRFRCAGELSPNELAKKLAAQRLNIRKKKNAAAHS